MSDPRPTRRRLLAIASGAIAAGLGGCQSPNETIGTRTTAPPTDTVSDSPATATGPDPTNTQTPTNDPTRTATPRSPVPDAVGLETVVSDLSRPVDIAFPPDADLRYVAAQSGPIHVVDRDGVRDEPLLDLSDEIERHFEAGVLGIALHPEFASNRRLFVRYSAPLRDGMPEDYSHAFVLAEFEVSEDGLRADPDSERSVLEIPQPSANHNSGVVVFGPDGYLYVGTGDGGHANDTGMGHVDDWYEANEGGNGQDTSENLLGAVLRLDVDDRDGDQGYAVPDDNPLVGTEEHLPEYYAWGLRNPWGASFDGDRFFVGDAGQARREEVNLVEKGGNYGWNVKEGSTCFDASNRIAVPEECPDETPPDVRGGEPLRDPIIEYTHGEDGDLSGATVVGGCVYRGSDIPALEGRYVFGDFQPDGRLFVGVPPADGPADGPWSTTTVDLAGDVAGQLEQILGFGRNEAGDVYVLGGDGVYRIVPAD